MHSSHQVQEVVALLVWGDRMEASSQLHPQVCDALGVEGPSWELSGWLMCVELCTRHSYTDNKNIYNSYRKTNILSLCAREAMQEPEIQ